MTVSSQQSYVEYNADGSTTTFTVPFYFLQGSDLGVTIRYSDNTTIDLTYGVNFSASGAGNPAGGSVTLNAAYQAGAKVLILRSPPATQETQYAENGKFPAKSHEKALDKLTMLVQRWNYWWDNLALKKPNFFSSYYDAKQNRIANLADPGLDQDAVNNRSMRSYVDAAIAGVVGGFGWFLQSGAGAVPRTFQDKMREIVTAGDYGVAPTRIVYSDDSNTALGAHSFQSFSVNAVYNTFVGAHAGESIVGDPGDIAIGAENVGVGRGAGRNLTTGLRNVFIGAEAGSFATTASYNIQIGAQSSSASGIKTGSLNTICGYNAGKNWTTAIRNSFYGSDAGSATTTGNDNSAFGQAAMQNNTTGGGNTYLGAFSGTETGTGGNNLAAGRSALFRNVDGAGNVALGREAALGVSGTGASPNNITVMGFQAGWSQNGLTGVVFCGMQAGYRATTMADTVLLGRAAGFNLTTGSNNVMVGAATGDSETTGTQLVYLGHGAGRFLIDGSAATGKLNCVAIGYQARVGGNHEIQMGNSSQIVYVYGTVQTRSDERDKADVRDIPADVAVAFVRGLRSCMYKFDYRDDYIEEYIEEVGTDAEGKPVYETKIRHLDKDGSKKRTREHAGYLAQQVKELLDKLGFDCGIYQDHLVNEGGCDVKTLAYEQTIPFITKALDVAFTKLDDIEKRLSKLESQ